jgi:hypothetical protein
MRKVLLLSLAAAAFAAASAGFSGLAPRGRTLRTRGRGQAARAARRSRRARQTPAHAAPIPQFPHRASWLGERLLERGWSNSDPSNHRGPDRKTIERILRGGAVRNDVLEKLAHALSAKHNVSVLDIPQD